MIPLVCVCCKSLVFEWVMPLHTLGRFVPQWLTGTECSSRLFPLCCSLQVQVVTVSIPIRRRTGNRSELPPSEWGLDCHYKNHHHHQQFNLFNPINPGKYRLPRQLLILIQRPLEDVGCNAN